MAGTCAPIRGTPWVEEPFLVVEVLSDSTRDRDLGFKVQRYNRLPSVQEIWLIDSVERWVQVWRRGGEAWIVTLPLAGDARFSSAALELEIELAELYRNTTL